MNKGLKAFVAMGLVGTAATVAQADPAVINITGATLLQNFVKSPASTRDFIDVDHDGITLDENVGIRQQLAPDIALPVGGTFPANTKWLVHYRAVGSVNGLKELLRNGRTYFSGSSTDSLGFPVAAVGASDGAYFNRTLFTAGGVASGAGASAFNAANPGGFPWLSTTPVTGVAPTAVFPGGAGNGLRADVTPLDVPTRWAVSKTGSAAASRQPAQNGYGLNPAPTRRKDGVATAYGDAATSPGTYWSRLADQGNATIAGAPGVAADGNTLFDTPLAYAPVAPITNVGTGLQQVKMSELQHLFVTGRMPSGENLTAVTRDAGSGTRNGFMNSLRIDPSYGVGENIGVESNATNEQQPGALYTPSNKGGSGTLETCVRYTRLGVGYTGAERTVSLMGADNRAEVLGVMNDVLGGNVYVRPTAANVISNNNVNTWRIAGPAQLVTFGDPQAEAVVDGGEGSANPRLRNPAAAAYVNNIRKSIAAFSLTNSQNTITNAFSPGEAAATFFILPAGVEYVPDVSDKNGNGNLLEWIANDQLNASLRDWELANSTYGIPANVPLFATFGTGSTGQAPQRTTGATYSDGVVGGGNYKNQAGVNVSFNSTLDVRNKLAGDFDADGLRNVNDIPGMIAAWRDRQGLGAWDGVGVNGGASNTAAVIEILGDFNNDGTFNAEDVRYFADGLAMTTGANPHLDRKAGFTAVDNASFAQGGALNFFGATKATGSVYAAGDSRADIAGARVTVDTLGATVPAYFKQTAGYAPTGRDGVIDGNDITYVFRQFKGKANVPAEIVHWSNLGESQGADLSADMNGDMQIDIQDVQEIVVNILGTTMGDVNLDGSQNQADADIITANMGLTNATWQQGDLDGDGVVTAQDMSVYLGRTKCGRADVGQQGGASGFDGSLDNNDFIVFINYFFAQNPIADQGQQGGVPGSDGQYDNNDFIAFIANFFGGCH
ncbi:MAG: GC-type dockerin domain-anchored protein [Phycisphaerales bacterium]